MRKMKLAEFQHCKAIKTAFMSYLKHFVFIHELNEKREILLHQSFWDKGSRYEYFLVDKTTGDCQNISFGLHQFPGTVPSKTIVIPSDKLFVIGGISDGKVRTMSIYE